MSVTVAQDEHASAGRFRRSAPKPVELSAKKRIRVGVFTESYPPVVNGVTTSVMTLVEELERLGHCVTVFAPRFPGHTGDPPNVVRFPSVLTPFDPGYPLPVPISRQLLQSAARYKLDVIHSQSPFMLGLVAMMVARHEHKPLVATNHTLYTEYSHYIPLVPEEITKGVTRQMVRWYYERCDAVIAPSKMAARRLIDGYGIHRTIVKVVPTGIPLPTDVPQDRQLAAKRSYGVPDNAPMLLFAGRIAKEKNLEMLLDSFEHQVSPSHPDAHLVLAGAGVDAEHIQDLIDRSPLLRSRVRLTGFLHRADLEPLYAASDLFVFPSVTETQGVVLGEALAAGTPCCAVNAAGTPETVTDGADGILTANDPVDFGAAINRLLEDTALRTQMSEVARKLAEERTPSHMVQRIVSVYRTAQKRVNMRRFHWYSPITPEIIARLRRPVSLHKAE
jgi:glycosyltransferase involved in cell wall biosynthesis